MQLSSVSNLVLSQPGDNVEGALIYCEFTCGVPDLGVIDGIRWKEH